MSPSFLLIAEPTVEKAAEVFCPAWDSVSWVFLYLREEEQRKSGEWWSKMEAEKSKNKVECELYIFLNGEANFFCSGHKPMHLIQIEGNWLNFINPTAVSSTTQAKYPWCNSKKAKALQAEWHSNSNSRRYIMRGWQRKHYCNGDKETEAPKKQIEWKQNKKKLTLQSWQCHPEWKRLKDIYK